MLRDNMSYKKVTRTLNFDILPTEYQEESLAKVIFLISLIFFPMTSFKPSSAEEEN